MVNPDQDELFAGHGMSEFKVLDIETTGNEPWTGDLICVGLGSTVYPGEKGRTMAALALSRPGIVVCHTTYDLRWLGLAGVRLGNGVEFHDTKVMAWMLDATQELSLDAVTERYVGYVPDKRIRRQKGRLVFRLDSGEYVPIEETPWEQMEAYNRSDIEATASLYVTLRSELQNRDLWELFLEEEAPFSRLMVECEVTGLPYDRERGVELLEDVEQQAAEMRDGLIRGVGCPDFNPGSNQQVSKFLYHEQFTLPTRFPIPRMNGMSKDEKMTAARRIAPEHVIVRKVGRDYAHGDYVIQGWGLPVPKVFGKEQHGEIPTVNSNVLTLNHLENPFVADLLKWRKVERLVTGFLRPWAEQAHEGRLHGRLNQAGTVTGRLSSSEPNLQNIPAGDQFNVRDLFRGDLVIGDYAGLEVRLSAHFSHDPLMLDIFRNGKDLYGVLAANAWGGVETKKNPRRGLMKVVMLGSQYGARGEKLAFVLAVAGMTGYTARKANAMLKELEETLPRLFEWREEVIDEARTLGYVTTLAGRRRQLPDINSAVWKASAHAERQAVNSKVQGSAADVVRRAMLRARERYSPAEEARIILQVHDEILWERGPGWNDDMLDEIRELCETGHGFELDVPLVFEPKVAGSWAEKEGSTGQVHAGQYADLDAAMSSV